MSTTHAAGLTKSMVLDYKAGCVLAQLDREYIGFVVACMHFNWIYVQDDM